MTNAQLREKRIDCPDLYASAAATVAQIRCSDVIVAIRNEQGHCGEAV